MTDGRDDTSEELSPEAAKMEDVRRNSASAWMEIAGNRTIPIVIDALLDAPPGKEFNKTELADYAGTTPESIRNHIQNLIKFQIVEKVPDTNPTRYRLDTSSPTIKRLLQLNGALNTVSVSEDRVQAEREDVASDPMELSPDFPSRPKANEFDV